MPTGNDKQYAFGPVKIGLKKDSARFVLYDSKEEVTAYDVLKLLSPGSFKSYAEKIVPQNDKIKLLPPSERIRAVFYFRRLRRQPPMLENADTIAAFIKLCEQVHKQHPAKAELESLP